MGRDGSVGSGGEGRGERREFVFALGRKKVGYYAGYG